MSARKRVPCGGVPGRTHRSAPTRGGRYSEPTENWCEDRPCQRGGTEPAPYGCNRAGRSTAGCGHPALRERHRWYAATGRCGHRPLQEEGEASATTQASGTERIVHAAVARDGWNSEQKASPKCPATSDNPSVSLRLTAPFTQGSLSLRGTGDADCRVGPVGLLAMTAVFCHSEERSDVGIRPFYDGRGFGPPHERRGERHAESSCPTESPINHPGQRRTAERLRQRVRGMDGNRRKDHPKRRTAAAIARAALSEAESAERAAGQIRFLPDNLRVQHGVQGSETCEKPRPCSRRGYAD